MAERHGSRGTAGASEGELKVAAVQPLPPGLTGGRGPVLGQLSDWSTGT